MREIKTEIDTKKHVLIRCPVNSNLYQLRLYDLSQSEVKIVEYLSSPLKAKNANKQGRELAENLKIRYFKKLSSAANTEQKQALHKIYKKLKQEKREAWNKAQGENWSNWRSNFDSEKIAIAEAIKIMNAWIKNLGKISQDFWDYDYYSDRVIKCKIYPPGQQMWVNVAYKIKNYWLEQNQESLIVGKTVRFEGNKKYLYYHKLEIEKQIYEFHSHIKPKNLFKEPGVDFEPFSGKKLSVKEIAKVKQKCSIESVDRFIEMLGWKLLNKKFW